MDLNVAIQKHAQWKFRLASALRSNESLDAATISKDKCCELGTWLDGQGKVQYQHLPSYEKCVASHTQFHIEAGKIAAAINARRVAEAERMLGSGAPFAEASKNASIAIIELQNQLNMELKKRVRA